jgi:hypothetical protein
MLVSGMIVGTLFTLLVVPSIYMLVARKRKAVAALVEEPIRVEMRRHPRLGGVLER